MKMVKDVNKIFKSFHNSLKTVILNCIDISFVLKKRNKKKNADRNEWIKVETRVSILSTLPVDGQQIYFNDVCFNYYD